MTPDTTRTEHPLTLVPAKQHPDYKPYRGGFVHESHYAGPSCAADCVGPHLQPIYMDAQAQAQTAAAVEALRELVDAWDSDVVERQDEALLDADRVLDDLSTASARFIADVEKPWRALRDAAQAVLDEWDSFGPTGTASTLASHRRLRDALLATTPSAEGGE